MSNKKMTYYTTTYSNGLDKQTIVFNTTDSSSYKITYDWLKTCSNTYTVYDEVAFLPILTVNHIEDTKLVSKTEEKIEDYIQENCDRYTIREYGWYIYEKIQEKAYEITCQVVEDAKEDYDIADEDAIVDAIMELIDFDELYELVDDILHAPVTMEEKLADVGMSVRDFL